MNYFEMSKAELDAQLKKLEKEYADYKIHYSKVYAETYCNVTALICLNMFPDII